ncbi:hypothetical protein GJ496_007151 [Pomphorhynchus laevis]|nr:hypothetical protein GJ496_007151 [Pomphorhynchus laevis]
MSFRLTAKNMRKLQKTACPKITPCNFSPVFCCQSKGHCTSEQQLLPELAARVSGLLLNSKNVYDNTLVYIVGWVLYWQLGIAEYLTVDDVPVVEIVTTADNVIPYRNLRVAAAEPTYQSLAADLSNSSFVLFSENWNDEDIVVLAGMAAGLPRLKTHANYAINCRLWVLTQHQSILYITELESVLCMLGI